MDILRRKREGVLPLNIPLRCGFYRQQYCHFLLSLLSRILVLTSWSASSIIPKVESYLGGDTVICLSMFQEFTEVGCMEPKQLLCDVSITVSKVTSVSVVLWGSSMFFWDAVLSVSQSVGQSTRTTAVVKSSYLCCSKVHASFSQ
jgi:hypothetical protein